MRLLIRLIPHAASDSIDGVDLLADGSHVLKVRVRAVPEKGRANKALIKLLAKAFGVAPTYVSVIRGAGARKKTLQINGDPAELMHRAAVLPGLNT